MGSKWVQVTIYLLVYDYVHFDTGFGPTLEDSVEAVILIKFTWPPEINLRGKPPVLGVGSYTATLRWRSSRRGVHTMMKITSLALSNISDSAQR